jgi:hypothetical protein
MSGIKRELERLADIIIYGTPETIEREFEEVIDTGGGANWIAGAIDWARQLAPLCKCGADYYTDLYDRFPQYVEATNKKNILVECLHDWAVEKLTSFCLNCGELEDQINGGATNA